MATRYTIHEREVEAKQLPGRSHKMIIQPGVFGVKNMSFGVADFPPMAHAPAHVHDKEEEILYVLSGAGEMYFDGAAEPLEPGTCMYVPARVEHSINNTGRAVLKVAYVFSPPVRQGSYDRKE
jgi:mannose-6-phosphate isomerase-like protein (cupin superfamily)